jgi:hypothetical protein
MKSALTLTGNWKGNGQSERTHEITVMSGLDFTGLDGSRFISSIISTSTSISEGNVWVSCGITRLMAA